jgi:hypothetical protein
LCPVRTSWLDVSSPQKGTQLAAYQVIFTAPVKQTQSLNQTALHAEVVTLIKCPQVAISSQPDLASGYRTISFIYGIAGEISGFPRKFSGDGQSQSWYGLWSRFVKIKGLR